MESFRIHKSNSKQRWEGHLAENLPGDDPHGALHAHYASLFYTGAKFPTRSLSPSVSLDVTEQELAKLKPNKNVSHDGVSTELMIAVMQQDAGRHALLKWYNSILHSEVIPDDWSQVLMVLIPKVSLPKAVRDTRPISMGCTAEKIFGHLLFPGVLVPSACSPLSLQKPWQCAGQSRQSADYIHSIYKLMECEREWGASLSVVKIDFARAFDTVSSNALLPRLLTKLGDCEEFRAFENLMGNTSCSLLTAWSQSVFCTDVGIRQGAIETPHAL